MLGRDGRTKKIHSVKEFLPEAYGTCREQRFRAKEPDVYPQILKYMRTPTLYNTILKTRYVEQKAPLLVNFTGNI